MDLIGKALAVLHDYLDAASQDILGRSGHVGYCGSPFRYHKRSMFYWSIFKGWKLGWKCFVEENLSGYLLNTQHPWFIVENLRSSMHTSNSMHKHH